MLTDTRAETAERDTSLPLVTGNGSAPSAFARNTGRIDSGSDGADQRSAARFQEGSSRIAGGQEFAAAHVEPTVRSTTALLGSTRSVLSAHQFECFLERERSLADRGTRRFSLLVLRRRSPPAAGGKSARKERGGRDALAVLAQQVCKRLRSTDLVGRLDAQRVEILLTDTEPAGAQVVARWVEQVRAKLGLDLEQTIYVYPSVAEASAGEQDGDPRAGGRLNGMANGTANGRPVNGKPTNGHANGHGNGHLNGHALSAPREASERTESAHDVHWKLADLWPRLGVPMPAWKRALDIVFSVFALLMLSPLFALIAIAIRLDSPGPVIFEQMRAGRGARAFVFYKFRSMIVGAEEARAALAAQNEQRGPIFKIREDPRVTRVGRWLRRWSIDELPQLWNVLKGDISLVGPRSPTFDEVCKYERWQRRRLCVTGGITCIWQVSGRSQIPFREWMRLDMRYVACRNLWLDLRLLVLTLPAVISGRGAC